MTYLPTLSVFPVVYLEITFAAVFSPSVKPGFISFWPKNAYFEAENTQIKGNWQFLKEIWERGKEIQLT